MNESFSRFSAQFGDSHFHIFRRKRFVFGLLEYWISQLIKNYLSHRYFGHAIGRITKECLFELHFHMYYV